MEKKVNNLMTQVLTAGIRVYQVARAGRPSPCRYQPTCSEFALESLRLHGPGRGSLLAVRRILRCHPWGGSGFDPVPPVVVVSPVAAAAVVSIEEEKVLEPSATTGRVVGRQELVG